MVLLSFPQFPQFTMWSKSEFVVEMTVLVQRVGRCCICIFICIWICASAYRCLCSVQAAKSCQSCESRSCKAALQWPPRGRVGGLRRKESSPPKLVVGAVVETLTLVSS